ncbi:MAG: DUF3142 domain-containing protein [Proteobacteria bacterium]|nr:DUF3142 domain-containing protein [Pseudomonadota bacterium]
MRLLLVALACVICLTGSALPVRAPGPLPHDAYIWQRVWTPALVAAADRSADLIRNWRILVAEADRSGRWTDVEVSWDRVAATHRPVVAVLRIDGRLEEQRMAAMVDRVTDTIRGLRVPLAGVEIDYDCPTSRLADYARFLSALRGRLPPTLALSITALPTWMNSPELTRLGADVSEIVLQVHAVDDPRRGLFDPEQAERWVRTFALRTGRPFRVALPAYDVRVSWGADGRLAGVEGERPILAGAADSQMLMAAPEAVRHLLRRLEDNAPDGLVGVAWFRLPTDADRRAWSPETWRAVIAGQLPPAQVSAVLEATDQADLWNVVLANDGTVDAPLPRQIGLDPACAAADGANGFHLASSGTAPALEARSAGRLRAHTKRTIGWARCAQPQRQLDVAR